MKEWINVPVPMTPNYSSNVLLRIWTVSVVSNFLGSLQYIDPKEWTDVLKWTDVPVPKTLLRKSSHPLRSLSLHLPISTLQNYVQSSEPPNMVCRCPTLVCRCRILYLQHPTSVKNRLHFRTFSAKALHNPNKCFTFAAPEPAKPLYDA